MIRRCRSRRPNGLRAEAMQFLGLRYTNKNKQFGFHKEEIAAEKPFGKLEEIIWLCEMFLGFNLAFEFQSILKITYTNLNKLDDDTRYGIL